eukprot:GHRQ01009868.1.p2 GENE.GHRQ01009868.1~~GHRQ01009868.1.p2  ORF type:complete len:115 (-),score=29.11 GHRQ01009868.1:126-470(-)
MACCMHDDVKRLQQLLGLTAKAVGFLQCLAGRREPQRTYVYVPCIPAANFEAVIVSAVRSSAIAAVRVSMAGRWKAATGPEGGAGRASWCQVEAHCIWNDIVAHAPEGEQWLVQ